MSGTSNGELSPSAAFDDGAAADINNPFNKNDSINGQLSKQIFDTNKKLSYRMKRTYWPLIKRSQHTL